MSRLCARATVSSSGRLERLYTGAKHFAQNDVILVPFPMPGGELPDDADLIAWVSKLVTAIFPVPEAAAAASATA